MKETRFIAQNREKWTESETLISNRDHNPEKVSNLFTQVVDDLSYSRTYYKNRSVRIYLNNLARALFSIIYTREKKKKNWFRMFWTNELPQIVIYARRQLLISTLVFLLAVVIGVFSSAKDPEFTGAILGKGYVAMTKENIQNGDPMAVYKKGHQMEMFLGITLNNLRVAFLTYVCGLFLAIGTLAILLYNGVMVGAFQYFFVDHGLFAQSAMTIWLHGTLEISSVIIAGGAGLTLGSGLVFPGTYSRLQAFQLSATRSLKLLLGISPIIVLAAVIESFLTRYTEVPDVLRLFLIVMSAVFIIGYFVIYPWRKAKAGFEEPLAEMRLSPAVRENVVFDRIKNNAELLKDSFLFYKKNANMLLSWSWVVSLSVAVAYLLTQQDDIQLRWRGIEWDAQVKMAAFASYVPTIAQLLIFTASTSLIFFRTFWMIDADEKRLTTPRQSALSMMQILIVTGMLYSAIYWLGFGGVLLLLFCFMLFLLTAYIQQTEDESVLRSFGTAWTLTFSNLGQIVGLQVILFLMAISFMMILYAPLLGMNLTWMKWNFGQGAWIKSVLIFVEIFFRAFVFNLILPLFAATTAYLYYSLREVNTASHLKAAIAKIGSKISHKER